MPERAVHPRRTRPGLGRGDRHQHLRRRPADAGRRWSTDPLGLVPDGTSYTVGVLCELNGSRLVDFPRDVTLTTPDQLSQTITGLPVGCRLLRVRDRHQRRDVAADVRPTGHRGLPVRTGDHRRAAAGPDHDHGHQHLPRCERPGRQGGRRTAGRGRPRGHASSRSRSAVTCLLITRPHPAQCPGYPQTLTIQAGPAGQPGTPVAVRSGAGRLRRARSSRPTTTAPPTSTITPHQPVTIDDEQTPVEVTVTNTFEDGGLTIEKVVDGPAAGLVPVDTEYTAQVVCTFGGQTVFNQELPFGVSSPATVSDLPVGAECTVTETDSPGRRHGDRRPARPGDDHRWSDAGRGERHQHLPGGLGAVRRRWSTVRWRAWRRRVRSSRWRWTVELPAGFPGAPGPVPGYPTSVTIEAGPAGSPGSRCPSARCRSARRARVTESDSNGASRDVRSRRTSSRSTGRIRSWM